MGRFGVGAGDLGLRPGVGVGGGGVGAVGAWGVGGGGFGGELGGFWVVSRMGDSKW